jgi:chaperonin GroES
MNFTPLYDRVLIRPIKPEETTTGGIIIPDTAKEKPIHGEVLAVGEGRILEDGTTAPLRVKVGDIVVYSKHGGYTAVPIQVNYDDELLVIKESEIVGIVN